MDRRQTDGNKFGKSELPLPYSAATMAASLRVGLPGLSPWGFLFPRRALHGLPQTAQGAQSPQAV